VPADWNPNNNKIEVIGGGGGGAGYQSGVDWGGGAAGDGFAKLMAAFGGDGFAKFERPKQRPLSRGAAVGSGVGRMRHSGYVSMVML
jgi:hypothetical protein